MFWPNQGFAKLPFFQATYKTAHQNVDISTTVSQRLGDWIMVPVCSPKRPFKKKLVFFLNRFWHGHILLEFWTLIFPTASVPSRHYIHCSRSSSLLFHFLPFFSFHVCVKTSKKYFCRIFLTVLSNRMGCLVGKSGNMRQKYFLDVLSQTHSLKTYSFLTSVCVKTSKKYFCRKFC